MKKDLCTSGETLSSTYVAHESQKERNCKDSFEEFNNIMYN